MTFVHQGSCLTIVSAIVVVIAHRDVLQISACTCNDNRSRTADTRHSRLDSNHYTIGALANERDIVNLDCITTIRSGPRLRVFVFAIVIGAVFQEDKTTQTTGRAIELLDSCTEFIDSAHHLIVIDQQAGFRNIGSNEMRVTLDVKGIAVSGRECLTRLCLPTSEDIALVRLLGEGYLGAAGVTRY